MAAQYVKFLRGSQTAFNKLLSKNNDTLYFIEQNKDDTNVAYNLYLGDKLITNSLQDLRDLSLKGVAANDLLIYDNNQKVWKNIDFNSFIELLNIPSISVFTGAKAATDTEVAKAGSTGLVPAPKAGEDSYFLKGDGTWSDLQPIISNKVNEGISSIVNGAPETFDTLKEISDWIGTDKSGATMMINKISGIESQVGSLNDSVSGLISSVGNLDNLLTTEKGSIVSSINEIVQNLTWGTI